MKSRPVPPDHPGLPRLVQGLQSFAPLPGSEAENLRKAIRVETIPSGGRMNPSAIGFILSGLLRAYYLDSAGKERTKTFWNEDNLVYSLGATHARPGSPGEVLEDWTIEAVEPTELFTLSLEKLDQLYCGDPSWNHVGRVFWQFAYREKLVREREFLILSATDRYREFQRVHSGWADRIPQYLVASYLGITPVALSRLRARRSKPKVDGRPSKD